MKGEEGSVRRMRYRGRSREKKRRESNFVDVVDEMSGGGGAGAEVVHDSGGDEENEGRREAAPGGADEPHSHQQHVRSICMHEDGPERGERASLLVSLPRFRLHFCLHLLSFLLPAIYIARGVEEEEEDELVSHPTQICLYRRQSILPSTNFPCKLVVVFPSSSPSRTLLVAPVTVLDEAEATEWP